MIGEHTSETQICTVLYRDMPLRKSPDQIIHNFNKEFGDTRPSHEQSLELDSENNVGSSQMESLGLRSATKRDKEELQQFINKWFLQPGTDTEPIEFSLGCGDTIKNRNSKQSMDKLPTFEGLLGSMSKLCRKACHPDSGMKSSLIHAPYPFVIPGERFRESYYWDSYWIIKGLLKEKSHYEFCLGIVRNFAYMVQKVGMVPNGFRSYYLNRSQPPMLTCMVSELYNHSDCKMDLIAEFLHTMKQELLFWRESKRTIRLAGNVVASRYYSEWPKPRPESLSEDLHTFESYKAHLDWARIPKEERRSLQNTFFCNISAAAESGWDFSSRWLDESNTLPSIRTIRILPVDLNAILFKSERLVSGFAKEIGDIETSIQFDRFYRERRQSFVSIFWDPLKSKWRDVLLTKDCSAIAEFSRQEDYASDWVPLWCLDEDGDKETLAQAIESLRNSKINAFGGISASSIFTGQQWDWPNVWPPLQYFLAEGCWSVARIIRLGAEIQNDTDIQNAAVKAQMLGDEIKNRFLVSIRHAWDQKHTLPEKFDCEHHGGFGFGGEYECVEGFGWTTGLALHWLED